jgi:hypothetical protein
VISKEVVEGAAQPLYIYADRADRGATRVHRSTKPNLPSGGQVVDIEIGAFLIAAGNGPEKQELLRLIGTLV